jgi:hypothetical protein
LNSKLDLNSERKKSGTQFPFQPEGLNLGPGHHRPFPFFLSILRQPNKHHLADVAHSRPAGLLACAAHSDPAHLQGRSLPLAEPRCCLVSPVMPLLCISVGSPPSAPSKSCQPITSPAPCFPSSPFPFGTKMATPLNSSTSH